MAQEITSILQWNPQGLSNKKDELLEIIEENKSSIIALQETKLTGEYNLKIPNYNKIFKDGHYNRGPHGGVCIYIHTSLPYREITVQSPLQVVAAQIFLGTLFTVCNIYVSPSHDFSIENLQHIYDQVPKPCLMLGDLTHIIQYGDAVLLTHVAGLWRDSWKIPVFASSTMARQPGSDIIRNLQST